MYSSLTCLDSFCVERQTSCFDRHIETGGKVLAAALKLSANTDVSGMLLRGLMAQR